MRQIAKENRPIRHMEMIAYSAKEMFQKAHHKPACDLLEEFEPKELVSVVRIGTFVDLAEGPFCEELKGAFAFQIVKLQHFGDGEIRVEGVVAADKETLKVFLKKLRRYDEENHLRLGKKRRFWELLEGNLLWLEKGMEIREKLLAFLKHHAPFSPMAIEGCSNALELYGKSLKMQTTRTVSTWAVVKRGEGFEGNAGLFEEVAQTVVEQKIYCSDEEKRLVTLSLLQSIHKTLIILGFHPLLCLAAARGGAKRLNWLEPELKKLVGSFRFEPKEIGETELRWIVADGLGVERIAAQIEVGEILKCKLGVERILALLLELRAENLTQDLQV